MVKWDSMLELHVGLGQAQEHFNLDIARDDNMIYTTKVL